MNFGPSSRLLAIVGIMAGPFVATSPAPTGDEAAGKQDPRLVRLEKYFEEKQCPVKPLARDFVAAADRHNLDWRLLPSIAFVESSGGKTQGCWILHQVGRQVGDESHTHTAFTCPSSEFIQ